MVGILTVLMALVIGYLFNVRRRLSLLEQQIADGAFSLPIDEPNWAVSEPVEAHEPAEEATQTESGPEPTVAAPMILYAERRPEEVSEPVQFEAEPDEPPEEAIAEEPRQKFGFEELFGRRLPIWAGGITLAIAGVLIVKLSIEAGLLSPTVRVISGALFGLALIGGAELALRNQDRVGDERVRQSLSGAGLASLYATILIAANLYQLISPGLAMVGVALVTGFAMFLALRFGAPSALLGLVGGLAAPAMVGSPEPNVPLLSVYLALAVGGLTALSRSQRWAWLGVTALLGGFGWGLALLVGGALDTPGTISLGMYIILLGVALPALGLAGERRDQVQLIAGVLAAAQMAALVATGGFSMLNWGLFGLIAAAMGWLSTREDSLKLLPPIALTVALLLLASWSDPNVTQFILVAIGLALIQGFLPLRRLWTDRGGLLDAAQLAAILLGGWVIAMRHFYVEGEPSEQMLGFVALALAAGIAVIASLGWRTAERREDARFAILATSAAILLAASIGLLAPTFLVGPGIAAVGLALLHVGQLAEDRRLEPIAWIFAGSGLLTAIVGSFFPESDPQEVARWGLLAVTIGLFAWRARIEAGRMTAQFLVPVLLFAAIGTLTADRFVALIPPLLLVAAAAAARALPGGRLMPAMIGSVLMTLIGSLELLGLWVQSGVISIAGQPMLLNMVPQLEQVAIKLAAPAVLGGIALRLSWLRLSDLERRIGSMLVAVLGVIALHCLYKHLFAIRSVERFVAVGLGERLVWEFLLAGAAAAALWGKRDVLGYALAGAAALHFIFYSLLIHNPLWSAQHVGVWPFLNLLLPLYGLGLVLLHIGARSPIGEVAGVERLIDGTRMILIGLFALSTLRQLFHGSLLVEPGLGQAEDIGRSLVAIGLAIGFLLWGIKRGNRDWRIASLVLMLGAVGKVFLMDAAGLEGITRIGSFVALGFSLIGIGWLYSRHLSGDAPQLANAGSSR